MMNVGFISNHTFPSIGYAINAIEKGRMSLPVSPSQVIYSHFKHISGTPAPEGTQGINISKLKIINTMIEQLSKLKSQASIDIGVINENDEKRINTLIEQFHREIKEAQNINFYTPTAPSTGALFSITV
jgi:hypothetical protein